MAHILPHTERFIEVFNRLKNERKLPSNKEIAKIIGVKSANTLTEIRRGRQNIQIDQLQKFCEVYDLNFHDMVSNLDSSTDESNSFNGQSDSDNLIPYYELDLLSEDHDATVNVPNYCMNIPEFTGCVAFRIYSDSMAPLLKPGGVMFCRKINDWKEILEFGQIYAIRLYDGRKFLKYIYKHHDVDKVILKSANPEQDEFEVPKDKILHVWLVEGWMNRKTQ